MLKPPWAAHPVTPALLTPAHVKNEKTGQSETYHASTQQKADSETIWVKTTSDPVAFYTAILAVATIGLWIFTALMWRATKRAVDDAARNADRQSDDTRDAIQLARDEFNATHRPRIILRNVSRIEEDGPKIIYSLVNTGTAPAIITQSWIHIETVGRQQSVRNLRPIGYNDLGRVFIQVGESIDFTKDIDSSALFMITHGLTKLKQASEFVALSSTHFTGALIYTDTHGKAERTCVFRRIWEPASNGFVRSHDPDHEYSD